MSEEKLWRHFPQFERTFESLPGVLQKIELTCRQLDGVFKTGSAEEKVRAQAAMTAYGRTLELIKQISDIREATQKK